MVAVRDHEEEEVGTNKVKLVLYWSLPAVVKQNRIFNVTYRYRVSNVDYLRTNEVSTDWLIDIIPTLSLGFPMIVNKFGSVEMNKFSFFCGFSSNKFRSVEINKSNFSRGFFK